MHPLFRATPIALAVAAGSVWSQGVVISGIADAAGRSVSNEGRGSVKSLVSGGNSTSRIIIRGTEDLGGGLSAGFHLEHGILLDVGNPASTTQFWDRRSTLSLSGKAWGEMRAGRDFVPSYVNWSRYDPFSYVGVAGSNNLVSATPQGPIRSTYGTAPNTTVRSSNTLQWFMPSGWGGLEGGILVAPGEGGVAASGQAKVQGARVGYATKTWAVSTAHTRSENDLTAAGGAFTDQALGGSVDFGMVRVSAVQRRFKQNLSKQTNTLLGAWIPIGLHEIKLSWVKADLSGRVGAATIDANDASQIGLGYVYNLSKRTVLYGSFSRLDNKGAATFVVPGGPAGMAGGGTSSGYEVGMRMGF